MLRRASFLKDSSCLFTDKDYLSYTLLIDSGFFRPTFVTNSLKIHIFLEVLFTPFCYFYYYLLYFILFYFKNSRLEITKFHPEADLHFVMSIL